jgi:hypothetical protein
MSEKLKILSPNKTVVFSSPIEGDDVLTRTGTISEKNSFFHSVLHAYSSEYVNMDNQSRIKFVNRLKESLTETVSKDIWEELDNGLTAKIPFQENVKNILLNFYMFINGDKKATGKSTKNVILKLINNNETKLEIYEIITELIPLSEGFEKNILPDAYRKCENGFISDCKRMLSRETIKYVKNTEVFTSINKQKADKILNILNDFIDTITEEAEDSSYTNYIDSLKNVSNEINPHTIGLLSDKFNRDIYFIDSRTRMPYYATDIENIKNRKSIIVMWTGDTHYEIVGRLLQENRIQREFKFDDILIQKIKTFLFEPENIPNTYQELVPYLPKEYRRSPKRVGTYYESDDSDNERFRSSDEEESSGFEYSSDNN